MITREEAKGTHVFLIVLLAYCIGCITMYLSIHYYDKEAKPYITLFEYKVSSIQANPVDKEIMYEATNGEYGCTWSSFDNDTMYIGKTVQLIIK